MQRRNLGQSDLEVSVQGLGCMEIAGWYGARDDTEATAALDRALELGVNFFDSADVYGAGENEEFLGRWLKGRRDQVILATKFGSTWGDDGRPTGISGTPDHVRAACDASLARLDIDVIDLYYQHRVDPDVPIEDTVGAMAGLVEAGKVRYIGLSEAAPATLRRAAAVYPITALQTEYSLLSREPEAELIPLCRELGTAFVAYSPIARGFLTDVVPRGEDLPPNDFRSAFPRFLGDNYDENLGLIDVVRKLAGQKNCTTAQIALAWAHAKGDDIFPIPGTKRRRYVEENAAAVDIRLMADEITALEAALPPNIARGTRYPESSMARIHL